MFEGCAFLLLMLIGVDILMVSFQPSENQIKVRRQTKNMTSIWKTHIAVTSRFDFHSWNSKEVKSGADPHGRNRTSKKFALILRNLETGVHFKSKTRSEICLLIGHFLPKNSNGQSCSAFGPPHMRFRYHYRELRR